MSEYLFVKKKYYFLVGNAFTRRLFKFSVFYLLKVVKLIKSLFRIQFSTDFLRKFTQLRCWDPQISGDDAPSNTTWVARLNSRDIGHVDGKCAEPLKRVTTQEMVEKMMLCYVTEECKWRRLPRLWVCLLNMYIYYSLHVELVNVDQKHERAQQFETL